MRGGWRGEKIYKEGKKNSTWHLVDKRNPLVMYPFIILYMFIEKGVAEERILESRVEN